MVNRSKTKFVCVCGLVGLFLLFEIYILLGVIEYSLWWQVDYLWQTDYETALPSLKNHYLRYWLVLPFYWGSTVLQCSPSYLFSITVPLIVWLTVYVICKTQDRKPIGSKSAVVLFLAISMLTLPMNGRMVFVYLGSSLLLYCATKITTKNTMTKKQVILLLASLWLTSVSSGTVIIAYMFVLLVLACLLLVNKFRLTVIPAIMLIFLLMFFGAEVYKFIVKSISFYGEGMGAIAAIPSHGSGQYVGATLGLAIAVIFGALSLWILMKVQHVVYRTSASLFFLGIAGGIFGLSTLTIVVIPLVSIIYTSCFAFITKPDQKGGANHGAS